MKAAVTTGVIREIVVQEVPTPVVAPGKILLRTHCCSVCGTDLKYFENSLAYRPGGALKAGAIVGHEYCAEVVEVGAGVEGWSVGDRATMSAVRPTCGVCYFCRRREPELCNGKDNERGIYTQVVGYGGRTGALAEYILREPVALLKIPEHVSNEEAALVEPLNVGVGAVDVSQIKPGDSAVIYGAGKIGLSNLLVAKAAGASPIFVVDIHQNRLELATQMGADVVLNAGEDDVIQEVVKITRAGPDVVFICVRAGEVFNESADLVRRGGKIIISGLMIPAEVNPGMWVPKKLKIFTVFRQTPMVRSLKLIAGGQVDVKPMITEIIPLEEIQRACDAMWSGKNIVSMMTP